MSLYLPASDREMSKSLIENRIREATVEPLDVETFEAQFVEFETEIPADPSSVQLTVNLLTVFSAYYFNRKLS